MDTILLVIFVLVVGSFLIKLLHGMLRLAIIGVLVVILFGGGWATLQDWGNEVKERVEVNVKNDKEDQKPNANKNKNKNKNKKQNNR